MKVFFYSILYINVCLVSLFFIIWLLTSVLMADAKTSVVPVNIQKTGMQGADKHGMQGANKQGMQGANKHGMQGANKQGMQGANKQGANKQDADKQRAGNNNKQIEFSGELPPPIPTDIQRADIQRADMQQTDMHGADKQGANKHDANKHGADIKPNIPTSQNNQAVKKDVTGIQKIDKNIQDLITQLSPYLYHPENSLRKNPFSSIFKKKETLPSIGEIPTYPTSKYNLNEINLVGIKWNSQIGPSTALLKTPDNITHSMHIHDQIGKNKGVIYQIKEDEIVILEPRLTGSVNDSKDVYVPIIMRLARWKNVNTGEVFEQIKD